MLNFQDILRHFYFWTILLHRKFRKLTKQDILGHLNFIETKNNRG